MKSSSASQEEQAEMDRFERLPTASGKQNLSAETHEFLFGALAELVDNASDSGAKNLKIFTQKCPGYSVNFSLSFLDDGCGMEPSEARQAINFGGSKKPENPEQIGKFGFGLKSGSMRIGKDLIVFTKKNHMGTIMLVSSSFLEGEKLQVIKCPIPSFQLDAKGKPKFSKMSTNKELQLLELEIIYKYSPYKSIGSLMGQFDLISSESGTLATVFNLRLDEQRAPELDVETDLMDIQMRNLRVTYTSQAQLAHKSFREYVSMLYLIPRMKIYIQNKRVITKRLDRMLFRPVSYKFSAKELETVALTGKNEALAMYKNACDSLKNADSLYASQKISHRQKKLTDHQLATCTQEREKVREEAVVAKEYFDYKNRSFNEHSTLTFTFGVNLANKYADGLFVYCANRLVMPFVESIEQRATENLRGIVGIVDVSYSVLRPALDKQSFRNSLAIQSLLKSMGEHLECYGRSLGINSEFWIKNRGSSPKTVRQCTKCLKWRSVSERCLVRDDWTCAQNTGEDLNDCSHGESLELFPTEVFRSKIYAYAATCQAKNQSPKKRILSMYESDETPCKRIKLEEEAIIKLIQPSQVVCSHISSSQPTASQLPKKRGRPRKNVSCSPKISTSTLLNNSGASKTPLKIVRYETRARLSESNEAVISQLKASLEEERAKNALKEAHSSHLKKLLVDLCGAFSQEDIDKINNLDDKSLANFKIDKFIEACKVRERERIKVQMKKRLSDCRQPINSLLAKPELKDNEVDELTKKVLVNIYKSLVKWI